MDSASNAVCIVGSTAGDLYDDALVLEEFDLVLGKYSMTDGSFVSGIQGLGSGNDYGPQQCTERVPTAYLWPTTEIMVRLLWRNSARPCTHGGADHSACRAANDFAYGGGRIHSSAERCSHGVWPTTEQCRALFPRRMPIPHASGLERCSHGGADHSSAERC